jgi:hypothetical protein
MKFGVIASAAREAILHRSSATDEDCFAPRKRRAKKQKGREAFCLRAQLFDSDEP